MSQASIARQNLINQVAKDGTLMLSGRVLTSFVKDLIHENATYQKDGLHLSINQLSRPELKKFLSVLLDPSDYEFYSENNFRLDLGIHEYRDEMQSLIDANINDVWHEIMQEKGMVLRTYADNGEVYYSRK